MLAISQSSQDLPRNFHWYNSYSRSCV